MILTINGKKIEAPEGATLLDTALENGIEIPRLCHHPELSTWGGCRLCLVEVEGLPAPVPSCGYVARDGMVVTTHSDKLTAMRRESLDLLLSDHPMKCLACEKAGKCGLQTYAYEFGLAESSHEIEIGRTRYQDDNAFFVRDHQYCILCTKCVRVCDEIVGAKAIEVGQRGFVSYVATPFDAPLADTTCTFCGNCVQVCPTAALVPVDRIGKGREWDMTHTRTICPYCGTGCGIEVATKNGEVVYVNGIEDSPANGGYLCTKGRFGLGFATHADRLKKPLVRRDLAFELGLTDTPPPESLKNSVLGRAGAPLDSHIEVDWETALELVSDRLAAITAASGADAVAGIGSALASNEDNYMFQKVMRAGVGTGNVDLCARV